MLLKLNVYENKFLEGAIKKFRGLQAALFLDIELRKSTTKSILPTGLPRLTRPPRPKGQLILKADWCAIDSPKKRTDEFVLFVFVLFMVNKSNSSVRFLGESTARQSAIRFYLTFRPSLDLQR